MRKIAYSLIGLTFAATTAYAQPADPAGAVPPPDASNPAESVPPSDVPPSDIPPAEPAPSDALPPAEPAPPSDPLADGSATTSASTFTDAEIDSFAAATVEVQKIDADTTLDAAAKQTQMAAAVTEAGIDPAKYNEIGQALATDTELRTKVQTAMAKHAGPPAG